VESQKRCMPSRQEKAQTSLMAKIIGKVISVITN
jgi:hypothetical protein